jgi:type VI secretion system secreted protein VgrG
VILIQRQTKLDIDLGGEQIKVLRVEATEALGRPFAMSVDFLAPLGEIDLLPHMGKPAGITVFHEDALMRYFHGIVVEGEYLAEQFNGFHYRLSLRPWTYLMSRTKNYAIFQDKSVIDIAKIIFAKCGSAKVSYAKLSKDRKKRVYCVQYGESDFAFLTRLFEEEGIYYYFDHSPDKHEMILCEAVGSHEDGKSAAMIYNPASDSITNADATARTVLAKKDYISRWFERITTGGEAKVTMRDFDFENATGPITITAELPLQHPEDKGEVYEYPGRYVTAAEGKPLGETLLASLRSTRKSYTGETQVTSLACGRVFKMVKHPNARFNGRYVITRTHHVTSTEQYGTNAGASESKVFFETIPADTLWQTTQTMPRPIVKGPETAIVTGPEGETIFTDEYGRVKVRFHWDRADTKGDSCTCWIRVSQTGGLGNIVLPRVGHEVIVDFLNGDPDRPIVVGRVFNSVNMPVYKLPDNKTRAVWRTKSYGGSSSGGAVTLDTGNPSANEIRFEDKGGKEEFFMHAEHDMNVRVRHNRSLHVGGDEEIKIGQDRSEYVKRNEAVKIDGSREVKIAGSDLLKVEKSITIKSDTTIDIEAASRITLKCGGSTIEMTPSKIDIKTTMLSIDGGGKADITSALTTIKADGMMTVKGAMVLIN